MIKILVMISALVLSVSACGVKDDPLPVEKENKE